MSKLAQRKSGPFRVGKAERPPAVAPQRSAGNSDEDYQ